MQLPKERRRTGFCVSRSIFTHPDKKSNTVNHVWILQTRIGPARLVCLHASEFLGGRRSDVSHEGVRSDNLSTQDIISGHKIIHPCDWPTVFISHALSLPLLPFQQILPYSK